MNSKKIILALIFCMMLHADEQKMLDNALLPVQNFTVYVLLDKKSKQGPLWEIKSDEGFWLSDPFKPEKREKYTKTSCCFENKEGKIFVDGRRLAIKRICIEPIKGELSFGGRTYSGLLYLLPKEKEFHLINGVDLEEYVCSVLCSESWPGWPLEVNKVFAIAQRSYLVAQMLRARGKKQLGKGFLYDLGCTNKHQTYRGSHKFASLRQAVDETRGVVLSHSKRPILAMYDTCCGGIIPSGIKELNFEKAPYLSRPYPCTSCTKSKAFSWKASYTVNEVIQLLKAAGKKAGKIERIAVVKKDAAGLTERVLIKTKNGNIFLSKKEVYKIFKDIKSYCFSAVKQGNTIVFNGKGYGHHVGLCQWGARQMVKEGWDYTSILRFYYPGTTFMKLKVGVAGK